MKKREYRSDGWRYSFPKIRIEGRQHAESNYASGER
jgi:hypothetical protein